MLISTPLLLGPALLCSSYSTGDNDAASILPFWCFDFSGLDFSMLSFREENQDVRGFVWNPTTDEWQKQLKPGPLDAIL